MSSGAAFRHDNMTFSPKNVDVINLFTEDLAEAKSFYEEILGLERAFEDETSVLYKLGNIMVHLVLPSEGAQLITPAAVASPGSGSRFVLAVFVDDVDAICADLAQRGVKLLNGPVNRPWGMRTASFSDPAGHVWEIGQDLDVP
jgi:catechol 2,3-dioxygenase-like lactoylglutathione lyase family enzyme